MFLADCTSRSVGCSESSKLNVQQLHEKLKNGVIWNCLVELIAIDFAFYI